MKNFFKRTFRVKFRKFTEQELMDWFHSNKKKIFCSGDVDIDENGIEWIFDKGNSAIKIAWNEIADVYVSAESGAENIYIRSKDGRKINFYVNNRDNCRNNFLKYLREYAVLKGSVLDPAS